MDLNFDVAGNTADFVKNAEQISSVIGAITSEVERQGQSVGLSMSLLSSSISDTAGKSDILSGALKKMFNAVGGKDAIKELVTEVVRVRSEFQQLEVTFGTLLDSKEKADTLMAQVMNTAAESPFSVADLAAGAKQLLNYGVQAEDVNDTLLNLGDIAIGLGIPLEHLTSIYGKCMSQEQLYAQDLEQFTTSGIPMLQGLADMYGITTGEVNRMVSVGQIGFPEVQRVIANLTGEGGKFHNVMQEQSQTLAGKINNLRDAWKLMLNNIGESQEGVMANAIDGAGYLLENYEGIGRILTALVATYGTYKAAVIAVSVIESVRYQATLIQMAGMTKMQAITDILRVKTELLNKTMLSNPYILIPTLIIGVVAAMWALHDSTTAAEQAQERFNKKQEDSKNEAEDYKRKLQQLVDELQDETTAEVRKLEIRNEIQKDYPAFFKFLTDEKGHIGDLTAAWKAFNEEAARKKSTQHESSVAELKQKIAEEKRFLELMSMGPKKKQNALKDPTDLSILKKYNGKGTYYVKRDIEVDENELREFEKEVRNDKFLEWQGDLQNKTDKQIEAVRAALKRRLRAAQSDRHLANALNKRINAIEIEKNKRKQHPVKKENTDNGKNDGDNLDTDHLYQIHKQQKDYESLLEKNKRDQARIEIDAQNSVNQSIIDEMVNGASKTLAQRDLNHKKEIEAIRREAEDKKQALIDKGKAEFEANPTNKEKDFVVTDYLNDEVVAGQFKRINEDAEKKIQSKIVQFSRGDDLVNLLEEYQDYTQKRLAIEEKFNADISILNEQRKIAVQNGDTNQIEKIDRAKAQATTEKGKALMGLDYEKLKESPDYIRAFENLNETSSDTLKSLLAQLEDAKQTAANVLSPDQLREYTTTIQEVIDELDSRNPFQSLVDRKQELAEAEQELAEAKRNLENVNSGDKVISGSKYNSQTGKIDTSYLTATQALGNYNKAKDKTVKANAKVQNAEKEVSDVVAELSGAIKGVGDAIGGQAGEIISLIGDIGTFAMTAMSGVTTASTTASESVKAVEKASVILAIVSAAIQIATKIASLFKDDDGVAKYERAAEVYESYIDILDKVIEKQKELFDLNSKTGEQAYETAKGLVQKQESASRELGKQYLESGASKGFLGISSSSSEGVKQRKDISNKAWNEARNVLGRDFNSKGIGEGRMTGLFDLSVEQLKKLQKDAPLFWAELHSDTQKYLQQIIDCNDELINLENDRKTGLVKTDFEGFLDSFTGALTDMDSSSKDFADSFEDYLKNAILSSLITDKYKGRIKKLYDSWASATESGGELTKEEVEALRKEQEAITEEMLKERQTLTDTFGWNSSGNAPEESTRSGFEAMSQETGSELNGRFTALQISNEEIKNSMLIALGNLSALCTTTSDGNILLSEMRNLALMSNGYLEDIARYTKPILGFGEKLDKIEKNTAKL